jgi:SAM-dependent methyltransferase
MDDQRRLYQELHAKHQGKAQGLGHGSWRSQLKRFEAACEVTDLRGLSVLDVGCGYGDLVPFLVARRVGLYRGIDIVPEFVQEARQRYQDIQEDVDFEVLDVLEAARRGEQTHDVVVALGTAGFTDEGFFRQLLAACFRLAKQVAVVTVPTVFSPGYRQVPGRERPVLFLHPSDTARLAAELTTRFTLRHDYLPTDQMLYLWRTP